MKPKDVGEGRRLWPVGRHFCISQHDCWMPGTYETEAAAMLAFGHPDETLTRLQDAFAPNPIPEAALGASAPAERSGAEQDPTKTDPGRAEQSPKSARPTPSEGE